MLVQLRSADFARAELLTGPGCTGLVDPSHVTYILLSRWTHSLYPGVKAKLLTLAPGLPQPWANSCWNVEDTSSRVTGNSALTDHVWLCHASWLPGPGGPWPAVSTARQIHVNALFSWPLILSFLFVNDALNKRLYPFSIHFCKKFRC
jgi:hypothetical protein